MKLKPMDLKKRRIIVNNDYFNIFQVKPPVTDQDIYDAVDRMIAPAVSGSQVDALFLNVPADLSPAIADEIVRLYDHPCADPCLNSLADLKAAGKDPWKMVVERARKRGLDVFASFRMNDTHFKDQPFSLWMPEFYYDNLHHRVNPTATLTRVDTEFDYRKSVVRERYFDAIKHIVEHYVVDGVELDFTRNCRFFPEPHREECAPIMTDFVRQIRIYLDQAGKAKGRRLELAATIPFSLYRARKEGLDVPAWARLGYLDLLCLSTPFEVDTDRDVRDAILKVGDVPVYAGCDRNFQWPGRPLPKEAYRALALNYLRQGAAGFYAYNVMHWTMRLTDPPEALKISGGGSLGVHDAGLMAELGEVRTLEHQDKLYLMSHSPEVVDRPYGNLPVMVPADGEVTLRLTLGDEVARAAKEDVIECIYLQAISSDCDNSNHYTLKLNTIDLARQYAFSPYAIKPENRFIFPEPDNSMPAVPLEKVRRHRVRPIDLHPGVNYITIKSYGQPVTITDVELAILYRKAK